MVKLKYTCTLLLFFSFNVHAQKSSFTLDEAYSLATANYPAIKQKQLLQETAELTIENLQKSFLPQLNLNAQASYQSAVTKIPVSLPAFNIESPAKDQYRLTADVSQLIYDGGLIHEQQSLQSLNSKVEIQRIEIELYKVKERINQLYLGILYLDEQLKQVELVNQDINSGIKRVEAQVNNGVAFRSNLNLLKAELLKNDQRFIEIESSRKGFTDALSLLTGRPIDSNQTFDKPVSRSPVIQIARPELKLFDVQSELVQHQDKLIIAKNSPKASLFLQGGYGRPGLNALKNSFDAWYIGGLRLNWSLSGLYTKKKEQQIVGLNKKIIETQKETFILNTNTQLSQQQAEIVKLQKLIASDQQIILLRQSVKEAAKAQLDNGVITANDYIREVNAEDQAKQLLITHQLQLLQAEINFNTISGNQ